jgi:hypothetical protein
MMVRDVAVIALIGGLGAHAVPHCRSVVDGVLASAPVGLVLDLRRVIHDPQSIAVLGMLRRYVARQGTALWLAGVPRRVERDLHRADVLDRYYLAPTVAAAIRAAALAAPLGGSRPATIWGE